MRTFLPELRPLRALVQIAHGMAEHSARYARLAKALTEHGYAVYADDHRGHGQTAARPRRSGPLRGREGLGQGGRRPAWSLTTEIKSRHPGLPVFLMGHSMGSYIARGIRTAEHAS